MLPGSRWSRLAGVRTTVSRVSLPSPRPSDFWRRYLPIQYRLIRLLDPLVRAWWLAFGLGNVVELRVAGRRTGRVRSVLLGLLRDNGNWYLGHPNGDVAWTRNLEAAGTADLAFRGVPALTIQARRLPAGDLRDRAILATGQHVFPGSLVYRMARRHIRAVGTFFEIERVEA
jgi:hypothetical protein